MSPSSKQILILRAELSKPEFKTEAYSFPAAGESQLIQKEERKV